MALLLVLIALLLAIAAVYMVRRRITAFKRQMQTDSEKLAKLRRASENLLLMHLRKRAQLVSKLRESGKLGRLLKKNPELCELWHIDSKNVKMQQRLAPDRWLGMLNLSGGDAELPIIITQVSMDAAGRAQLDPDGNGVVSKLQLSAYIQDLKIDLRVVAACIELSGNEHIVSFLGCGASSSGFLNVINGSIDGTRTLRHCIWGAREKLSQRLVWWAGVLSGLSHIHLLGFLHGGLHSERVLCTDWDHKSSDVLKSSHMSRAIIADPWPMRSPVAHNGRNQWRELQKQMKHDFAYMSMAPELLKRGQGPPYTVNDEKAGLCTHDAPAGYSPAGDIYSAAIIGYELMMQQSPYPVHSETLASLKNRDVWIQRAKAHRDSVAMPSEVESDKTSDVTRVSTPRPRPRAFTTEGTRHLFVATDLETQKRNQISAILRGARPKMVSSNVIPRLRALISKAWRGTAADRPSMKSFRKCIMKATASQSVIARRITCDTKAQVESLPSKDLAVMNPLLPPGS